MNAGTFEDPFELEMEINTAVQYTARPGLGPISFAGTLTATPPSKLAPDRPAPDPQNGNELVNVLNPWVRSLDGLNLSPVYPVPDGMLLEVPYVVPVIR